MDDYFCPRLRVHGWIERGIVVHLELAIKLEAALPADDQPPKAIKAPCKVVTLCLQQMKAFPVAFCVALGGIRPPDLLPRVKDLEGEDRQPSRIRPGDSECSSAAGEGRPSRRQGCEQNRVAALHQVVPALVRAVDGALDFGDFAIRSVRGSCLIFDMPEFEVRQMLVGNTVQEFAAGVRLWLSPRTPAGAKAT